MRASRAAEERTHARSQLVGVERLHEIVVDARTERDHAIERRAPRAHDEDRDVRYRTDRKGDAHTVESRKHEIKYEEIGHELREHLERRAPIPSDPDGMVVVAQELGDDVRGLEVVLGDENTHAALSRRALRVGPEWRDHAP